MMAVQPDPTGKLWVGGGASAVVIVIQWMLKTWGHVEMPTEVAMALSTIVGLAAAHFTPVGKKLVEVDPTPPGEIKPPPQA